MTKKEYSLDLRERVIEQINQGSIYKEVSILFKVSVSALGRRSRRYKNEGTYEV
jgi:transposase